MLCPMRLLFTVLTDSLIIWSRNFTLIYIFLFGLFLFETILQGVMLPTWELRWLLLFAAVLLLLAGIAAGWLNMVATACTRFLSKPREQAIREANPMEAFTLYREFFPGITRHFPNIAGGFLIQGTAIVLMFAAIQPLWGQNRELLARLFQLELEQREAALQSLSFAQNLSMGEMFLAIMACMLTFACFSLLFMLWPAFVVYYRNNSLTAYWRACLQYVKDPLCMLTLGGGFLASGITLYILTGLSLLVSPIIFLLLQMLMLLALVYMVIVTFVYAYHAVGKPVETPDDNPEDSLEKPPLA